MKQYIHQARIDVAPHIFATAESAYRNMITEEENQCVIISGESGAGKTEASKQIQTYIAEVSGGGEGVKKIKTIFLESNPVLEAFGNAKTLRNNNSSRFGKYFELKFNHFGIPEGGMVTNYLLEKSRICSPGKGERNFHIFYQLMKSDFTSKLLLPSPENMKTLSCSECYTVDGLDDKKEFDITLNALRAVGWGNSQIQSLLSLVAAVMHLGNVSFKSKQVDGVEGSAVANKASLECFCSLTKTDYKTVERALLVRELQTMAAGGVVESYEVPQSPTQAATRRDAVCKSLYERMFNLIVERINAALAAAGGELQDDVLSIGVLDIYGFEIFENNSFEQLCINYVNEKLQQIFIELTLRSEQAEYELEGITWAPIPFFNNKVVCDLLDSSRPSGVFRILDDTCKTMHGTKSGGDVDAKFIDTASQVHGSHKHFTKSSNTFTIKHYAGDVSYTGGKFGESNKDALGQDLVLMVQTSGVKLIKHMYSEVIDLNDKKGPPTAGQRIRVQCNALVTALMDCSPNYVRCIKSNDEKRPLHIDTNRVRHQSKYLGLSENIKVRRAGYAYRAEYHRFLERFNVLSKKTYPEWKGTDKAGCKEILKAIASQIPGLNKNEVQFGTSKIFIRQPETYFDVERLREVRMGDFVVCIQRAYRRYLHRKDFVQMQFAIAKLYKENGKTRRRDSIFRPYLGDYLDSCFPASKIDEIKDGIFRIIDFYNVSENIIFIDGEVKQLFNNPHGFTVDSNLRKVIIALTDGALYVLEVLSGIPPGIKIPGMTVPPTKSLPSVILRRRIELNSAHLRGIVLSRHADNAIAILCARQDANKASTPNVSHWVDDKSVEECPITKEKFSLFNRRHHCRLSGNIYSNNASNFTQLLPDFGCTSEVRVGDDFIGLSSTDPIEDLVLFCDKKSELMEHILTTWKAKNQNRNLEVTFSLQIALQPSVVPAVSVLPCEAITFQKDTTVPDEGVQISSTGRSQVVVMSPTGLSHNLVEERQKSMAARRKKAEKRRKKEEAARAERQAVKEAEREEQRQFRQQQKRIKASKEKAAKLQAEEERLNASAAKAKSGKGARKFGATSTSGVLKVAPVSGGAGSELAAKMAARRAKADN
jgi:myosin-1